MDFQLTHLHHYSDERVGVSYHKKLHLRIKTKYMGPVRNEIDINHESMAVY